jgi:cytochrome c oxidase subunit II
MLAGAAAIFALVMALLAWAFIHRGRETAVSECRWLIWGGIVFPTVTLTILLTFALAFGEYLLPRPGPDVLRVDARAERFFWRFTRADEGVETAGRLTIPVGRPVDIHVTSADVIHSFWIPRLGGKIDAIPGHTNVIRLIADRPGVYRGQCAEFCGTGHANMFFLVEAVEAPGPAQ